MLIKTLYGLFDGVPETSDPTFENLHEVTDKTGHQSQSAKVPYWSGIVHR